MRVWRGASGEIRRRRTSSMRSAHLPTKACLLPPPNRASAAAPGRPPRSRSRKCHTSLVVLETADSRSRDKENSPAHSRMRISRAGQVPLPLGREASQARQVPTVLPGVSLSLRWPGCGDKETDSVMTLAGGLRPSPRRSCRVEDVRGQVVADIAQRPRASGFWPQSSEGLCDAPCTLALRHD